jgi:uncharacterized protein (DUF2252 family)
MPLTPIAVRYKDRSAVLLQRRKLKMARSAHAYVRGSTVKFYEWLESSMGRSVPHGPAIWICGDCHVSNLGPISNTKGEIEIQIRDLDQTVIGNPAHDLIRLGLSLATAARGSDLPGVTTARMLEQMMQGYIASLMHDKRQQQLPKDIHLVMEDAQRRKWKHLARERIEDTRPTIPLGKKFWALSRREAREIATLFNGEPARKLITAVRSRDDGAAVEVVDAAYWMKGCSSLGQLRYAVLAGIGPSKDESFCLIDIKEAAAAAAPRYPDQIMPRDNARRIVEGALHLSPHLGERMLAARLMDRSVIVREMFPQDLKIEIDRLERGEAMLVARFLGQVVGRAHTRQLKRDACRAWRADLERTHSKSLDAPSWLWSCVVDLVTTHEAAYLEHCRRYAMEEIG